jgi:nitroreductase
MEVFDAVRTVLAVREFEDKPVPPETIHRIVESAYLTGSSRNGQPWHFIAIQDREMLNKLGELLPSGRYIPQAPLAVAVALEESEFAHADSGRAIQSMMLTAWSEGIGSNWVGFETSLGPVNPVLGVPPDMKLIAIVPFGYPVRKLGLGKKRRRPFDEVVHAERFGQHFTRS